MRIIAGSFKGRNLKSPGDHRTRPTADRVKEAWFSILGDRLVDATVLDLYAGSGALGLEGLSRGAKSVEFVETGKAALQALRENVSELDVDDRVRIHRTDALKFAVALAPRSFDIAVADPPYKSEGAAKLVAIFEQNPFAEVLAVEHRVTEVVQGDETRRYGDTALTFCYAK
ncbi:MAG: 16S rRNA (guanine(966)-N(2))-methyltransferase RsmD [Gemmatimonadota bacterium]|nr:16S rRNA (guanine(966)-N(2))-methyltransferase RsmD [Gemmatimonadota bacterium]